jgi:hypothetical protein
VTDHNTLDDLVRVATDHVSRCEADDCDAPATWFSLTGYRNRCDAHHVGYQRETSLAPAIRRLVAAGVLK